MPAAATSRTSPTSDAPIDDRGRVTLMRCRGSNEEIDGVRTPSMRNLLDKSSAAQSLDGLPSDGEPAFPRNERHIRGSKSDGKARKMRRSFCSDQPRARERMYAQS